MALYQFRLSDIGEGIAEAEIVAWHVQPGDKVKEDQNLVDVMTDKATVEMTSPVAGTVLAVHGAVGQMMAVGGVLVDLDLAETEMEPSHHAPLAAPATRHRAKELGIALESVTGTGPMGRITPADLDAMAAGKDGQSVEPSPVKEIAITGLRRKIAQRMQEAHRRIPQITYVEECDLTELEALRAELNTEGRGKLKLLPFFIRALVKVMPEFPQFNAHFDDERDILRHYGDVHVGIAVQTNAGLMVPVIRHAATHSLWALSDEVARLSQAARDGTIGREELTGSTITISSLGALGGLATTPIINAPEVAIIAPNRMVARPVAQGQFMALRQMMNLSSSFDHRIIDGHDAAMFIHRIKRMLEHPAMLFMGENAR